MAPMGGNGKNNVCDVLSFCGLFIRKIYLDNTFKRSGKLRIWSNFWSNKTSVLLCEGQKPPNSMIYVFLGVV